MDNNTRYYNIEPKKKSKKKPVIIFLSILIGVILLAAIISWFGSSGSSSAGMKSDHITVLHIEGTIAADSAETLYTSTYNHEWKMQQLDEAINNPSSKGLILYLDTPGGSVYETDELYFKILEYKETGRPVYSAMGSMAASGGYYISAPADKIIANRNCWTGSIGVTVGTFYDISALLDKYGIKTITITSGANKAMGSSVEPMTAEQQAIFQSLVDEAYLQFVDIVAEGRGMTVDQVKVLADGRIYTAQQAVKNGLVDRIGTLDTAIMDMQKTYCLEDCETNELIYENDDIFASLLAKASALSGSSSSSQNGDIAALVELMEKQNSMPITYMSDMVK